MTRDQKWPLDKQKRTHKRRLLVQSEADIRHEITANNSSQPITHGVVEYRGTTAPTTRHRVSRQNAFLLSLLKYERDHSRCLCLHVCRISQQGSQQNAFLKAKKSISSRINLLSPPLRPPRTEPFARFPLLVRSKVFVMMQEIEPSLLEILTFK